MDWYEKAKPKWYQTRIKVESPQKFEELMIWMQQNIPANRKHTIWRLTGDDYFEIKFRFERDYEWFIIRWS